MAKKHKHLYTIGITAFIFALTLSIVTGFGINISKYNYEIGQIARQTIRAPFTFNVIKSDVMLEEEALIAMQAHLPIYRVSEEINFSILRQLDNFFIELNNLARESNAVMIDHLNNHEWSINPRFIEYLSVAENRLYIYNYLTEQLSQLLSIPIVADVDREKRFRFSHESIAENQRVLRSMSKSFAISRIVVDIRNTTVRGLVAEFLENIIIPNLVLDTDAIQAEKDQIKRHLDPIISRIERDEYIILKNESITEYDVMVLESLRIALLERNGVRNRGEVLFSMSGYLVYFIFILLLFYYLTKIFFTEKHFEGKKLILVYFSFLCNVMIMIFIQNILKIPNIVLIPFPMFALIIAMIYNSRYSLLYSFFAYILMGQFLDWDMLAVTNLLLGTIICLLVIRQTKQVNYLLIFLYLLSSLSFITIVIALINNEGIAALMLNLFYCFINSFISTMGAYIIVPKVEKILDIATRQKLLDLMDYNNPLMKRLAKEAQGTYYHSLVVGNLAEACAEAISANPMIARVGSYYHDIGKLEQPDHFIENIPAENIHDTLSPIDSARIIKNHVQNGIVMAKKAKLPKVIIDIIQQHHGDSRIRYFLNKANEMGIEYDPEDFQYTSPKPKTKEAVIVMISDIVESTTKSSFDQSEANIKKIIDDSVNNLLADEQLTEALITIRDLEIIKKTVLPILCSIYRKRIEYPKEV